MNARHGRARLAEIRWKPTEEGGRKDLPPCTGSPSSPTVRLLDEDEESPEQIATTTNDREVVIRKLEGDDELTDDGAEWLAEIAYRSNDAPHETLSIGRRFELYEGARCVASGVVVGIAGDRSPCSAMLEPFDR